MNGAREYTCISEKRSKRLSIDGPPLTARFEPTYIYCGLTS